MEEQEAGDSDSDADEGFADLQSVRDLRQHLCQTEHEYAESHTERLSSCDGEHGENISVAQSEQTLASSFLLQDEQTDRTCRSCGGTLSSSLEPPNEEARRQGGRSARGHRSKKVWTSSVCNDCHSVCNVTCRTLKRLWCSFQLNMNHPSFALVPKLLGRGGCNVKSIFEETGAKVRVRGRGSGHGEFLTGKEANIPLMVAVSSEGDDAAGFERALELTLELLRGVEQRYIQHCAANNHQDNQKAFAIGPPVNDRKDFRNLTSKELSKRLTHEIIARCQPVDAPQMDRSYENSIAEEPSYEAGSPSKLDGDVYTHSPDEDVDLSASAHSSMSASSTDGRHRRDGYGKNEIPAESYADAERYYARGGPGRGDRSSRKHGQRHEFGSTVASLGLLHGTASDYSMSGRRPYANGRNSHYYEEVAASNMLHASLYDFPYSYSSDGYSRPSAR